MLANIIHDTRRTDRLALLQKELAEQPSILPAFWPAVQCTNPVTGISRAHKQIIQYAKELYWPQVLILEDDVHFTAPGAYDYFISHIPEDYDLYLSGIYWGVIDENQQVKQFNSTHCYLCHSRFYDTVLAADETKNIDEDMWDKGKYIVCNPFAAIQHPGFSDNVGREVDYKDYLKGRRFFGGNDEQ